MAQSDSGLTLPSGLDTGAGSALIDRYLAELRSAMRRTRDSGDAIAEVEDHLREAIVHLSDGGLEPADAEREAVVRFGSAPVVARAFAAGGKGVVMPTRFTRRAGLAGIAAVVLAVAGAVSFTLTRTLSTLSDDTASKIRAYTFDPFMFFAAVLFVVFVVGLRHRNGNRFGALGNAALILMLVSPVLAAPFGWGGGVALVVILSIAFGVLSVALFRASVLPRRAVVAFGLAVPAGILIALAGAVRDALDANVDTSNFLPLGLVPFAVGLIWIAWTMWLEPAPGHAVRPGAGVGR
jgi:hypothetical protein